MRFAAIATVAAAVVAVPLALSASGARMSPDEFLGAVRCTAYENISGRQVAAAKYELNGEAQHQSPATVAEAEATVSAIARQAGTSQTIGDEDRLRTQREAACGVSPNAV